MSFRQPLLLLVFINLGTTHYSSTVQAQITPDNTLGTENSIVTPQQLRDVIEGGAIRGDKIFHSFSEFNVNEGQSVYFTNPESILNIFTRVTGANPSDIFGTLGVDGGANLILINPNGINFGANASLDVSGSFFATTSESIIFDNGLEFSATNPEAPPLLTVNLTPGLQLGLPAQAAITNAGNLAVGQDFTLSGSNLFLSGQLQAGNNLTLQASDLIQIRDSLANPFIASAGNKLLVQGNQNIDIFALIHPDSGLFSGGNMILRSANPIAGDAHFASGGNFRVEQLDGNLGELFSSNNPTIRSNGDVFLDSFTGTSLHILAGGRVEIPGTISITGAAEVGEAIVESVALSDGTIIEIDGSAAPTVDIRAGTTAFGDAFVSTGVGTNADINVGDIIFNSIGSDGGTVLLTNQYQPNTNLSGDITVSSISTGDSLGGGLVAIDSRGGITINGTVDVSAFADESGIVFGNGGDVKLLAQEDIIFNSGASIFSNGLLGGNITIKSDADISVIEGAISSNTLTDVANTTGGDINVTGSSVFLSNGARISANTLGAGDAGSVIITATDSISFDGESSLGFLSGAFTTVESGAMGNGGNVKISTSTLELTNGAQIAANIFGKGNAGSVIITATDTISFDGESNQGNPSGAFGTLESGAMGNAGNVEISTSILSLSNGAAIAASTFGEGDAGNVTINATDSISFDGRSSQNKLSGAFTTVESGAIGNAGNVEISTGILSLSDSAAIAVSTFGEGDAGNVTINATDSISFEEAIVTANTYGEGDAGNVTINATDTVSFAGQSSLGFLSGAFSTVQPGAMGNGGNVEISTGILSLSDSAVIAADTRGQGNAGNVTITATDSISFEEAVVTANTHGEGNAGNLRIIATDTVSFAGQSSQGFFSGAFTTVESGAIGNGGDIEIYTGSLELSKGATIAANTFGEGNTGNVIINATKTISFDGEFSASNPGGVFNRVEFGAIGNGGEVEISTGSLELTNGALIATSTFGEGDAGSVIINATKTISFDGESSLGNPSGVFSQVEPETTGNGGNVEIYTSTLELSNGALISANTIGEGDAGDVIINATGTISFDGELSQVDHPSGIFTSGVFNVVEPQGIGDGGNVEISTGSLELSNGALIANSTFGEGDTGSVTIMATDAISFDGTSSQGDSSGVLSQVESGAIGNGKNVEISTSTLELTNGGVISANTIGEGDAGDITIGTLELTVNGNSGILATTLTSTAGDVNINAGESVLVTDNSNISVEATEGGSAGNLTLTTEQLTVEGDSKINVSSPDGQAGNLEITSNNFLLNNSQITAETGLSSPDGGANITLEIADLLFLENQSLISATASNQANGGNVTINAGLIIAPPSPGAGSDISANADKGNGGFVSIATDGLFGISFQAVNTPFNDITVSSEAGDAGIVEILQPNVDPAESLTTLPTNLVDASRLIVRTCAAEEELLGRFVVTGRGGLPSNPGETISNETLLGEWISLPENRHNRVIVNTPQPKEANSNQQIIEARGWSVGVNGKIILTAEAMPETVGHNQLQAYRCFGAGGAGGAGKVGEAGEVGEKSLVFPSH